MALEEKRIVATRKLFKRLTGLAEKYNSGATDKQQKEWNLALKQ